MPRKKGLKKKKADKVGIGAIVEPGVGALYVRGSWMKKLKDLGRKKRKRPHTKK
ncbi:MAG: hypothetical protein PVF96_08355 [Candidatus Bathyarchaeota archaeon]|jgi:hypothetical protein